MGWPATVLSTNYVKAPVRFLPFLLLLSYLSVPLCDTNKCSFLVMKQGRGKCTTPVPLIYHSTEPQINEFKRVSPWHRTLHCKIMVQESFFLLN
jgi:hypothetical protein